MNHSKIYIKVVIQVNKGSRNKFMEIECHKVKNIKYIT